MPYLLSVLAATTRPRRSRGWRSCRPRTARRSTSCASPSRPWSGSGPASRCWAPSSLFTWWRKRRLPRSRWFYRAVMLAGPASLVALICGWITTEVGRQPWIVYETMRTSDAVTASDGLEIGFAVLGAIYLASGRRRRVAAAAPDREAAAHRGAGAGPPLMLPELCLGLIILGITAYALFGGADFGARLLGPDGRRRPPRRTPARPHPALDEPGVGGQPRVADLHPGHRVDGLPGRLRLAVLDPDHPAGPRRPRDHLPRHRVRPARAGGDDRRGARARRGLRAVVRPRAVLPRRRAGRRSPPAASPWATWRATRWTRG